MSFSYGFLERLEHFLEPRFYLFIYYILFINLFILKCWNLKFDLIVSGRADMFKTISVKRKGSSLVL